jgi:hypothetical protein
MIQVQSSGKGYKKTVSVATLTKGCVFTTSVTASIIKSELSGSWGREE